MDLFFRNQSLRKSLWSAVIAGLGGWLLSLADVRGSVPWTAFVDERPLPVTAVQVAGSEVTVWETPRSAPTLVFKPDTPGSPHLFSSPGYLTITYLDRGYGRLSTTYLGQDGRWHAPDKFTQVVLLDTGRMVTSYQRCDRPLAATPEIRVQRTEAAENTLAIAQVALDDEPPPDTHFRYLLEEAWKRPLADATRPAEGAGTLRGKVMVGYQGWFRTPNDPYDTGWRHWGDIAHGIFSVDMWPDVTSYPLRTLDKTNEVRTLSGEPGALFSSGWPEVVDLHFALMREHDIDGAFVQRFVSRSTLHSLGGGPEWVLGNVRAAANHEGRLWAVEYDVSGCPDGELLADLKRDWTWLIDEFGLRRDPAYAREGTRPVVFVWGMEVPDRQISPQTADAVVEFLQHDPDYGGNYVIGGLPAQWRTLDASWQRHLARYDGVLTWQSQNYGRDQADFRALGLDYYPHVWPGFSWANLKHLPTGSRAAFTPREGGDYYERLLSSAVGAGTDRLFVGMFDEYDEGTAILPMSDDPPASPTRTGVNLKFLDHGDAERPVNVRVPLIDLPVGELPPFKGIPAHDYAARFEGQIVPPSSGRYIFRVDAPDGDKAAFIPAPEPPRGPDAADDDPGLGLPLTAGQPLTFHLDYQHGRGTGRVRLLWSGPDLPEQLVPATACLDAWGRFLNNEGRSPDRWLTLTTKWKAELTRRLLNPDGASFQNPR